MALPRENCLSPPCLEWGECRDLISGNKDGVSVLPALLSCRPNQAVLSDFCTRLSLYVNVSKLRPAVTTEDLCYEIRKLISLHEVSRSTQFEIIALCELKQGYNDTVEITLVRTMKVSSHVLTCVRSMFSIYNRNVLVSVL